MPPLFSLGCGVGGFRGGTPSVLQSYFAAFGKTKSGRRIPLTSLRTCARYTCRWVTELLRQPLLATVVAQVYNFFEVLENVDLNESKSSMRRHTPGRVHFEVGFFSHAVPD